MEIKSNFRRILPHLGVILFFVAISFAYFSPILIGKDLPQSDNSQSLGMSNEIVQYEKVHPGEHPYWTNSMFCGMPTYLIIGGPTYNIFHSLLGYIRLFLPYTTVGILFILLVGFYLLLITLKLNKIISIAGALGFAFASFNFMIIAAGHITEAYAISFMPIILAGFMLLFNKRYLVGGILTIFAVGLEIAFNHPQIAYYIFLIVLVMFIVKFIYALKEKEYKHFLIVCGISIISVVLGVLPNMSNLLPINEYGKYSMRGPTEITKKGESQKSSGLDRDYAMQWSVGKSESFSVLVPNLMGAGVNGYKDDSKTVEELQKVGVQDAEKVAESLPVYWGDLPFTSAPAYFGAIICFLFIFGLFIVKGAEKWWLLAAAFFSITLAMGKHFSLISDFFFYYFPGYSKFRTPDMIRIVANFAFVLLGFLAIKEIIQGKVKKEDALKALKYSGGIVGGLLLIFMLIPGWFFDFSSFSDNQVVGQLKNAKWPTDLINNVMAAMRDDRESLLRLDSLRSFVFIALAFGLLWGLIAGKIKPLYFSIGLGVMILLDLWNVDRRYLNNDNFVSKTEYQNQFVKTPADEFILKDPDLDYRVLNLSKSVFNDAYTSYFHKSIGGYHGAKMRRYQDMIDGPISADLQKIQQIFSGKPTMEDINEGLKSLVTLNMLNTKYIIYNPEAAPIVNNAAYGNAWFVKEIKWVNNPDEEYTAVADFNPLRTAIIDKKWDDAITIQTIQFDSTAQIKLTSYKPDELEYSSKTNSEQLAVFSEIFYDKGWNAYIDGNPVKIGRADYILRTIIVPSGNHNIVFKFEPKTVYFSQHLALISSIVVIIITLIGLFFIFRKKEEV
jgi:predicted SnoaL-like aldol condensation-catalyzing enzyme